MPTYNDKSQPINTNRLDNRIPKSVLWRLNDIDDINRFELAHIVVNELNGSNAKDYYFKINAVDANR